jgi:hypothetical protein
MAIAQDNLAGTCAFLATYLAGQPIWTLKDGVHRRDFGIVWFSSHYCCIWDAERCSYLHAWPLGDKWGMYDVAAGRWLRAKKEGDEYRFTDKTTPSWFERVGIAPHEVHVSGSDGERCYGIEAQPARGEIRVHL